MKRGGGAEVSGTVIMERSRREKMNEMYAVLQSVVPKLLHKAPRAKIVDETIRYIGELEETVRKLEAAKKARKKAKTKNSSSSIAVTVSGKMAFFGVASQWRPGLATQIMQVFGKHKAEVLAATAVCDGVNGGSRSMRFSVTVYTEESSVDSIEEDLALLLP